MPRLLLILALLAPALHAATYVVPSDVEMVQRADDVVVATGVSAHSELTPSGGIVTRYVLRIEEVLKGQRSSGGHLVLTEPGGRVGDRALLVAGAPRYEPGVRYVVFTETNRQLEPITWGMGLGRFVVDGTLLRRDGLSGFDRNLEQHRERARDFIRFRELVRDVAAGRVPASTSFVEAASQPVAAATLTRGSYLLEGNFRWQEEPGARFVLAGTASPRNGESAAALAVSEWNATESNIAYSVGPRDETALGGMETPDGKDSIVFGDPVGELPSSVAGRGGAWAEGSYDLDGETFMSIVEVDVVLNPTTLPQSCYDTLLTHEVGHTLGLRHADQGSSGPPCPSPADCAFNAVMTARIDCDHQGRLAEWDKRAAAVVYGAGPPPPCDAPEITFTTPSTTISRGGSVELRIEAAGEGPIEYRWFEGAVGSFSRPLEEGARVVVSPFVSTSYWATATSSCGVASSAATVITVRSGKRRAVGR